MKFSKIWSSNEIFKFPHTLQNRIQKLFVWAAVKGFNNYNFCHVPCVQHSRLRFVYIFHWFRQQWLLLWGYVTPIWTWNDTSCSMSSFLPTDGRQYMGWEKSIFRIFDFRSVVFISQNMSFFSKLFKKCMRNRYFFLIITIRYCRTKYKILYFCRRLPR